MSIANETSQRMNGDFLKELRAFFGLTQPEFGEQLGLIKATVSKYENLEGGKSPPRKYRLAVAALDRQRRIITILREQGLFTIEHEVALVLALAKGTRIADFLMDLLGGVAMGDFRRYFDELEGRSLNPRVRAKFVEIFPRQSVVRRKPTASEIVSTQIDCGVDGTVLFASKCVLCGQAHVYSTSLEGALAAAPCENPYTRTRRCVRLTTDLDREG